MLSGYMGNGMRSTAPSRRFRSLTLARMRKTTPPWSAQSAMARSRQSLKKSKEGRGKNA